jgi:DNA-binding beta-propeller fold protein YncE
MRTSFFSRAAIATTIVASAMPLAGFAAFGDTSTYVSKIYYGDGKQALNAYFDFPQDIEVNAKGAFIIADTYNNVIRKIKTDGTVKTVAGNGSYGDQIGGASNAKFALPKGIDVGGKAVYVADTENDSIKKIKSGNVTTLVTGLNNPEDVALFDDTLYFLDTGNNALKKVSINGGSVTTITSSLSEPVKMDISSDGVYAYVANSGTYQVKRVNLSSGSISNVAGSGDEGADDGACSTATFDNLWGVHVHSDTVLFVSSGDGTDDTVRKIDLTGCTVSTLAVDSNMLSINYPRGLTSYEGSVYVAATGIGIIERYNVDDGDDHEHFAGANRFNVKDGSPVLVGNPKFMALSKDKDKIYFSENNRIREIDRDDLTTSRLIAGSVVDNYNRDDEDTFTGDVARFSDVTSFAVSKNGEKLYVVDRNNNRIREVVIATGETGYLTGAGRKNMVGGQDNGFADGDPCPNEFDQDVDGCAYFTRPTGAVLSKDGKYLYVSDASNNRIRRVTVTGDNKGHVTTIAGTGDEGYADGAGDAAKFHAPMGLSRSKGGKFLYVADRDNQRIRKINLETNVVSTYVGTGANGYLDATLDRAVLSYPEWLKVKRNGDIYFSEPGSNRIRMVDKSAGVTKLVAGSGDRGFKNGDQEEAQFNNPKGVLTLKHQVLVAELYNDLIRAIDTDGEPPYTDEAPTVSSVTTSSIAKEWFSGDTASIEIRGSNFRNGATSYAGTHESVNTYITSSTSLVMEIPISDMPAGHYTIRVQNSDGQYDDLSSGLAVSQNGSTPSTVYNP